MFRNQEQTEESVKNFAGRWVEPDRNALQVPWVSEIMAVSLVEALRPGIKGAAYGGMLIGRRNWGFRLEQIKFPKLYLWHGELDDQIPISSARVVAAKLTNCKASYYPEEGRISLIVNHFGEILKALM